MNYEFDEVARDQAEQVGAELSRIERHGGTEGDVEGAFGPLDEVAEQLEAALAEVKSLRGELEDRAEEVRTAVGLDEEDEEDLDDYSDGPLEGPLEEMYENAYAAQDGDFENVSAAEVL